MKKDRVIAVWVAVAVVTGIFWAQVAYMLGAPGWAVGIVALACAAVTFWFGCALMAGGEEGQ